MKKIIKKAVKKEKAEVEQPIEETDALRCAKCGRLLGGGYITTLKGKFCSPGCANS